jgi:hypothetical protein
MEATCVSEVLFQTTRPHISESSNPHIDQHKNLILYIMSDNGVLDIFLPRNTEFSPRRRHVRCVLYLHANTMVVWPDVRGRDYTTNTGRPIITLPQVFMRTCVI